MSEPQSVRSGSRVSGRTGWARSILWPPIRLPRSRPTRTLTSRPRRDGVGCRRAPVVQSARQRCDRQHRPPGRGAHAHPPHPSVRHDRGTLGPVHRQRAARVVGQRRHLDDRRSRPGRSRPARRHGSVAGVRCAAGVGDGRRRAPLGHDPGAPGPDDLRSGSAGRRRDGGLVHRLPAAHTGRGLVRHRRSRVVRRHRGRCDRPLRTLGDRFAGVELLRGATRGRGSLRHQAGRRPGRRPALVHETRAATRSAASR